MLKLEDLKVGDQIEFIDNEAKLSFFNDYEENYRLEDNCFVNGIAVVSILDNVEGLLILEHNNHGGSEVCI